jgi:hypothetical protein
MCDLYQEVLLTCARQLVVPGRFRSAVSFVRWRPREKRQIGAICPRLAVHCEDTTLYALQFTPGRPQLCAKALPLAACGQELAAFGGRLTGCTRRNAATKSHGIRQIRLLRCGCRTAQASARIPESSMLEAGIPASSLTFSIAG